MILTPLQKLPNNAGDLGKIIVATCFEWLPKVQKSPNLVTLLRGKVVSDHIMLGVKKWVLERCGQAPTIVIDISRDVNISNLLVGTCRFDSRVVIYTQKLYKMGH